MQPAIHVEENFYIVAASSLTDDRRRVLKNDETFAVFDALGDVQPVGVGEHGIYHEGTRFLSGLLLLLNGARPVLLSSTVDETNALLCADLTNPDIERDGDVILPRGSIHLFRSKFLWKAVCYECLRLHNYGLGPIDLELSIVFEADFADIFEVRGAKRARRGQIFPREVEDSSILLAYEGLDGIVRRTRISASAPAEVSERQIHFATTLGPHAETEVFVTMACEIGADRTPALSYTTALAASGTELKQLRSRDAQHLHRQRAVQRLAEPFRIRPPHDGHPYG